MGKILLTGDLHGDSLRLFLLNNDKFTKDDIVIVLGDFGMIWNDEEVAVQALGILGKVNFTIAFVDGNHEGFPLISKLETVKEWNGGKVGELPGGILHLLRGEVYNLNDKRIGVCGGANSVDLWHRKEGVSWWREEEIQDSDINNLINNLGDNKHLDLMLTHDCPASLTKQIAVFSGINGAKISNSQTQLEKINQEVEIDKWYFGHWHINLPLDDKFHCLYQEFREI